MENDRSPLLAAHPSASSAAGLLESSGGRRALELEAGSLPEHGGEGGGGAVRPRTGGPSGESPSPSGNA
jgi:hypothetical protein